MSDRELLELERLAHALDEERITGPEFARLQEMLRESESAREEYVRLTELGVSLGEMAGEGATDREAAIVAMPVTGLWKGWLAVAAWIVVLIVFAAYQHSRSPDVVAEALDAGCAVVARAFDVGVAEGPVPAGPLVVDGGMVELEFYSGASVVVEGPAELELRSPTELFLASGKLRARVPHHAKGFVVETPAFRAVDLGTEFAVWAGHDGRHELHVIEGEVALGGGRRLVAGDAFASGGEAVFSPDSFVSIGDLDARTAAGGQVDFEEWSAFSAGARADHRLAVYFPFGGDSSREIANAGGLDTPGADGSVVGARWVPGRIPGKRALSFKSSGDRVRVEVPGAYPAITLAAWVQVDGLDRVYNSLLLTDGWSTGNPHCQIDQEGRLILGVKKALGGDQYVFYSPPVFGAGTAGQWVHLASTFDSRTGRGAHYVNGECIEVYDAGAAADTPVRIGPAELGNWGLPATAGPRAVRNLNGKIDEFMLFTEALDGADVRRLYASKPDPSL